MKKKNLFIQSTLILLVGGFITRLIGFIIKIIYTRAVGEEGISLFSIVMPTYSMLITIATLSMPLTISKLVAEKKKRSISIMGNAFIITFLINFIVIFITIISSEFIANNLLHEPNSKYLLIAMSLTLPFVSISCIIKGYFLGKQQTMPYMVSNILEQILRLIIIIILIPKLLAISVVHAVIGLILLAIISETFSIIVFMFFMPKKVRITKEDIKYSCAIKSDILNVALPTVSSRIIGNIGYFFEPIILTNFLIFSGYSSSYVIHEYGAYNAYAISLLTMPAFFIQSFSQTIIPEISKHKSSGNIFMIKKRIKQITVVTLLLGIIFSIVILIFRDYILMFLYNTTVGSNYIRILAPIFVLFYLEGIFYSALQAVGKAKKAFQISLYGVIIKLIFLAILSLCKIGIYSLIIAEIINILFIIFVSFKTLKKEKLI